MPLRCVKNWLKGSDLPRVLREQRRKLFPCPVAASVFVLRLGVALWKATQQSGILAGDRCDLRVRALKEDSGRTALAENRAVGRSGGRPPPGGRVAGRSGRQSDGRAVGGSDDRTAGRSVELWRKIGRSGGRAVDRRGRAVGRPDGRADNRAADRPTVGRPDGREVGVAFGRIIERLGGPAV